MNEHTPPKRVQLCEAKARLSELVSAAERGEETVITRYGKAVARVVPEPSEEPKRVNDLASPYHGMTLGELLLNAPGPLEIERDRAPARIPDL